MNGGAEAVLGLNLVVQSHEPWESGVRRRDEEREDLQEETEFPSIFFHLLTLGDPERGPASSSRKRLISVLRSPVIWGKILLFLLD